VAVTPARISGNRARNARGKAVEHKRLLDCLAERDRLTRETGHYWGVTELALKENDPIRYERFYARLHAAAVSAYEAARYVTASPGAREMGEVVWGLLTPEGDAVAISPGFSSHLNAGQTAVRFMAEHLYDENPGGRDGDVFSTDDGASGGAPHPGDFYTYVPIVLQGQIIGWAMAVNHIMEVGTPVPGSFSAYAADTFWDGFVVPPIKTGENLRQYTWWEQMWLRRTRAGVSNILDDKMRLAGCAMIHQEVHRIVSEFGLDYYQRATREVIEETHQVVRENVKMTTLPGRYDGAALRTANAHGLMPLAEHANKDWLIHIRQRFMIESDGSIAASFDGTSHWGYHAFNFYPGGSNVGFYMGAIQTFLYNTKPTSGVTLAIKASYPSGSIYNPDR
jgi:acetone carboxylase alpha subunit